MIRDGQPVLPADCHDAVNGTVNFLYVSQL